jgi:ABC-type bacteriocin/lantibiotic exporter with double-glycine peptidase domain
MVMHMGRGGYAAMLLLIGGLLFALGILLLMVRLMMWLAWTASGAITVAGLVLLAIGALLAKPARGRRDEIEN